MERTTLTGRISGGTYRNGALTAIALLLGVIALKDTGFSLVSHASAQQGDEPREGLASAAEQRKQIIAELKGMSKKLDSLESKMTKGIAVKVTEMPEMKLPAELKKALNQSAHDSAANADK